ncbi:hypothetical protein L3Q82_008345 [Scortum barcoo]|uniref:Uncharacterized protein n=1 Tax=Scortum barcoo TaxID=214431 RepID=A0ACB8WHF9_9TELE|nr:hypothetical protein L3Q82_008345 [Scortum barcoo]
MLSFSQVSLEMDKTNPGFNSVEKYLETQSCTWVFNPPHAWERMIGIARYILDCMLLEQRKSHLTHEVLITLMAEAALRKRISSEEWKRVQGLADMFWNRWTVQKEERMVELWADQPCLFDINCPTYRDGVERKKNGLRLQKPCKCPIEDSETDTQGTVADEEVPTPVEDSTLDKD